MVMYKLKTKKGGKGIKEKTKIKSRKWVLKKYPKIPKRIK
jgi:hypothetical protein